MNRLNFEWWIDNFVLCVFFFIFCLLLQSLVSQILFFSVLCVRFSCFYKTIEFRNNRRISGSTCVCFVICWKSFASLNVSTRKCSFVVVIIIGSVNSGHFGERGTGDGKWGRERNIYELHHSFGGQCVWFIYLYTFLSYSKSQFFLFKPFFIFHFYTRSLLLSSLYLYFYKAFILQSHKKKSNRVMWFILS